MIAAATISFGVGLAIGAWLNNDCNWHTYTVFYHGWHGVGLISTSSRYVHINNVYVNRRYTNININRNVVDHHVNYSNIKHYNNVNRANVDRSNVNVNNVQRNSINNRNVNRNINTNNQDLDQYRGRVQGTNSANATRPTTRAAQQPAQGQSVFGGYGNADNTRMESQRGQASRARGRGGLFGGDGGGAGRRGGGLRRN